MFRSFRYLDAAAGIGKGPAEWSGSVPLRGVAGLMSATRGLPRFNRNSGSSLRSNQLLSVTKGNGIPAAIRCSNVRYGGPICRDIGILFHMRIVVALLIAQLAFSQSSDEAARLLRAVADSAKAMASWEIEGSIEYNESTSGSGRSEHFSIRMRAPNQTHFEQTGELAPGQSAPATIVCDGAFAWIFSPPLHRIQEASFRR